MKIEVTPMGDLSIPLINCDKISKLNELLNDSRKKIQRYNYLNNLREVIGNVADEYLRIQLQELKDTDETRKLLFSGCEAEMRELQREVNALNSQILSYLK